MVTATLNHLWQSTIIAAGLILISECLSPCSYLLDRLTNITNNIIDLAASKRLVT
jgi:hypothetical protein